MRTIGDLVLEAEPPSAATRAELRAQFDKLETAFGLLYDALNSVSDLLEGVRSVIARGDFAESDSAEEAAP